MFILVRAAPWPSVTATNMVMLQTKISDLSPSRTTLTPIRRRAHPMSTNPGADRSFRKSGSASASTISCGPLRA
ncbi:hypothetical protein TPAR_05253 [Tolypocladium paradoxum]|uniref:Uncharacterized protein n=1 Tax=Tolypocladium paradoxum TaxID=94208 RepID=A0A2S4KWL5_9HYPO|nr:hypothetical protein TPAR_05253 [Tolypocladium paradoxum]